MFECVCFCLDDCVCLFRYSANSNLALICNEIILKYINLSASQPSTSLSHSLPLVHTLKMKMMINHSNDDFNMTPSTLMDVDDDQVGVVAGGGNGGLRI